MYKITIVHVSTAELKIEEALSAEDAKKIAEWAVTNKYVPFKDFATAYEVEEA